MKVAVLALASLVTCGFLALGNLEGVAKAEPPIKPKAITLAKPIVASATLQDSADGIYLLNGATWHYGCQSQLETVHAAVDAMGLGGDWYYMQNILSRESCVDPGRMNSIGCRGLAQACPGDKLPCGPGDIPCQVSYFDQYAKLRYGSWANAWNFWQRTDCRPSCGTWW